MVKNIYAMSQKEQEFTIIIEQHRSTIYSVCFMFAKSSNEADDLFQEILIRLWQGFDNFRHESKLSTWVWRVSLNTCISADRKLKHHKEAAIDFGRNLYHDSDTESRQAQMLHERIQRLQPFDRAIVLLWLESMSYEEIAAIVGITPKNVSVRLYRIKEELKKMNNQ